MDFPHSKLLLTPEFLARSLHLKSPITIKGDLPFSAIITDSRKVVPGCLFVALKGENVDGHQYIESAIASGAKGILCQKNCLLKSTPHVSVFSVDDTLVAYRKLAAAWRKEFSIPIIIVAGSAGKTTTKEYLAAILQGKWKKVLKTQASQNGFIGIPMTLLELRPDHQAAVIEVGIDEVGAMQQHVAIINPTASVLTMIGPEHLEKLQDVPTVAREEGLALSLTSRAGGLVVINLDDPWIRPHATTLREGKKIAFTFQNPGTMENSIIGELSSDGKTLTYQGLGTSSSDKYELPMPLLGKHNASNLLAAVSVALGLGLNSNEIETGLSLFKGAEGRSEVKEITSNTPVICDYYNAQPASVRAGFELLTELARVSNPAKKRWVCLGDMLELGPNEEQFHRELADPILELGIEQVLLFGPRMAALFEELMARRFQGRVTHFATHAELAEALIQKIKPGDAILIKGSRGMKMEEVWKILERYAKTNWGSSQ